MFYSRVFQCSFTCSTLTLWFELCANVAPWVVLDVADSSPVRRHLTPQCCVCPPATVLRDRHRSSLVRPYFVSCRSSDCSLSDWPIPTSFLPSALATPHDTASALRAALGFRAVGLRAAGHLHQGIVVALVRRKTTHVCNHQGRERLKLCRNIFNLLPPSRLRKCSCRLKTSAPGRRKFARTVGEQFRKKQDRRRVRVQLEYISDRGGGTVCEQFHIEWCAADVVPWRRVQVQVEP